MGRLARARGGRKELRGRASFESAHETLGDFSRGPRAVTMPCTVPDRTVAAKASCIPIVQSENHAALPGSENRNCRSCPLHRTLPAPSTSNASRSLKMTSLDPSTDDGRVTNSSVCVRVPYQAVLLGPAWLA